MQNVIDVVSLIDRTISSYQPSSFGLFAVMVLLLVIYVCRLKVLQQLLYCFELPLLMVAAGSGNGVFWFLIIPFLGLLFIIRNVVLVNDTRKSIAGENCTSEDFNKFTKWVITRNNKKSNSIKILMLLVFLLYFTYPLLELFTNNGVALIGTILATIVVLIVKFIARFGTREKLRKLQEEYKLFRAEEEKKEEQRE